MKNIFKKFFISEAETCVSANVKQESTTAPVAAVDPLKAAATPINTKSSHIPPTMPLHVPPEVHPDFSKEHVVPLVKVAEANASAEITTKVIGPAKALLTPYTGVIEFKDVTKIFGKGEKSKIAIKDVSFTIKAKPNGNIVSLVGPSGCGKSTVLRIIAGLMPQFPHTTGEARAMGQPITGPDVNRGMVDQRYSLLPHLTVLDNIAFGLMLRGEGRGMRHDKAREWVKKVGLDGAENKYPHELSGGMQQRVSLASTLILQPKILLMDEPFGALDPKIRLRMQELLVSLWQEIKATVIIVTHSMEEAVYLGDKVYRMEANPGRLVEILEAPRPEIPPEEMRKYPWFRKMVDELTSRVENGDGAKGSLVKIPVDPKDDDELALFKLIS